MCNCTSELQEIEKEIDGPYKIEKNLMGHQFLGIDQKSKENVLFTFITDLFNSNKLTAKFLQSLQISSELNHENIIRLYNFKRVTYEKHKNSLVIVSDILDTDLGLVIKSDQELTEDHRRYFIYQILRALKYLHSANVVHNKLKPENIKINSNCDIKIQTVDTEIFYERIQSNRWYSSPEKLLEFQKQLFSSDVWSVGCILYELIMRNPLFTANNTLDQLRKISEKIGSPKDNDLFYLTNEKAISFMNSIQKVDEVDWNKLIPNATDNEIDLLKKMLVWNPAKRISVEEGLKHSYFNGLHDPSDEPCRSPIDILDIEQLCSMPDFESYFWNEITRIRKNKNFK